MGNYERLIVPATTSLDARGVGACDVVGRTLRQGEWYRVGQDFNVEVDIWTSGGDSRSLQSPAPECRLRPLGPDDFSVVSILESSDRAPYLVLEDGRILDDDMMSTLACELEEAEGLDVPRDKFVLMIKKCTVGHRVTDLILVDSPLQTDIDDLKGQIGAMQKQADVALVVAPVAAVAIGPTLKVMAEVVETLAAPSGPVWVVGKPILDTGIDALGELLAGELNAYGHTNAPGSIAELAIACRLLRQALEVVRSPEYDTYVFAKEEMTANPEHESSLFRARWYFRQAERHLSRARNQLH
jgi:hypothetical protein